LMCISAANRKRDHPFASRAVISEVHGAFMRSPRASAPREAQRSRGGYRRRTFPT
jgi:hypothetical protein